LYNHEINIIKIIANITLTIQYKETKDKRYKAGFGFGAVWEGWYPWKRIVQEKGIMVCGHCEEGC